MTMVSARTDNPDDSRQPNKPPITIQKKRVIAQSPLPYGPDDGSLSHHDRAHVYPMTCYLLTAKPTAA